MPPTMRAHCGACAGLMALVVDELGYYFVCDSCGCETPIRPTVAEADLDVVWVPVTDPGHTGHIILS
jgi:hypothetical protein